MWWFFSLLSALAQVSRNIIMKDLGHKLDEYITTLNEHLIRYDEHMNRIDDLIWKSFSQKTESSSD